MSIKIIVTQNIPKEGLKELFEKYYVIMPGKAGFSHVELLELIIDADVLLSVFSTPVTRELIEAGKKLKMVANFGVGYNNIDLEAAREKGIVITNTPDPVTLPTAEHTMGLILALLRRISEMDRKLRLNMVADWKVMSNLGFTLNGKILGIVGMGKIGQATSHMAQVFGMTVVYHSRNKLPDAEEKRLNIRWLTKNDLLKQADVVSLHVPLTDETRYWIGDCEFKLMKDTAFIINTSRGPVIHEAALAEALKTKEIAGAALDVFEDEPTINKALFTFENVVLTPHIGTGTIETRIATAACAAKNILAFLNGKELPNRVM